ncbi:unnamed protein product [Staurois parvus]|uniref:Uncharacterized protein n=1 Tax=Staurois parvus TaxID=386267 RepID=A0ABN9HYK4_9NEOB|nr:unnamed protein product [Staurois parvus]
MSLLLNIPQSTVNGIIIKWKQLGTTAAQPRSGRPCKITERGQCMLKHTVHRGRQLSADSIVKTSKLCVAFRELHLMGFRGPAAASKPYIT